MRLPSRRPVKISREAPDPLSQAAVSDVTYWLRDEPMRRAQYVRLGLAALVALTSGLFSESYARNSFYLIALLLTAVAAARLRALRTRPRLVFCMEHLEIWALFLRSPLILRYKSIRLIEWRAKGHVGFARIAADGLVPLTLASAWFDSTSAFEQIKEELRARAPQSTFIDHFKNRQVTPYVGLATAASLVAAHAYITRGAVAPDPLALIGDGAFVATLFSQAEWFRAISDAFLHISWVHLSVNLTLIGLAFMEVEVRVGHARTLILMIAGALGASISTWCFSRHFAAAGASGMAYGGVGAIAYQLMANPDRAPVAFRLTSPKLLLIILIIDATYGVFSQAVSFAMHAGGFISGFVVMAALSTTLNAPTHATKWLVNSLAVSGLALVASSALALYRYHAAGHPQRLMLLRLLGPETPPDLSNIAAYRLALNPAIDGDEVSAATRSAERVITGHGIPARELAAYRDTAAVLNFRSGKTQRARDLEQLAILGVASLPPDARTELPSYVAHLAQFELAALPVTHATTGTATAAITAQKGQLCLGTPPDANLALRAVILRKDTPIGLLLITSTALGRSRCVQAPSVTTTDPVHVTYVGPPLANGQARFFPVRAQDADLPAFVLHRNFANESAPARASMHSL